jgi:hypothetical protein
MNDQIKILEDKIAELEKRYEYADLHQSALNAIREACKEIMGGNLTFVDDDFARCLFTLKEKNEKYFNALKEISSQTTYEVYDPDHDDVPDFEYGYNECVRVAIEAIK